MASDALSVHFVVGLFLSTGSGGKGSGTLADRRHRQPFGELSRLQQHFATRAHAGDSIVHERGECDELAALLTTTAMIKATEVALASFRRRRNMAHPELADQQQAL